MRKENILKVFILAMIICLATVSVAFIYQVSYKPERNLEYTLIENDTAYEVSRGEGLASKKIIIPSKYKGKPVIKIANYAFSGNGIVKTIVLPSSIEQIGHTAFYSCERLEKINLPKNLQSIGSYAFSNCYNLSSITLPGNLSSIGQGAFDRCSYLTSIEIPDSVTEIGNFAFSNCSSLKNIKMSKNITRLDSDVFYNTAWLKNQSEGLAYIGNILYANIGQKWDDSMEIRSDCVAIAGSAFANNSELTSISIPDSVTSIGYRAFYDCVNLTNIHMTDSITRIGSSAFEGCESLSTILLSNNLTAIEANTFSKCGFSEVTLPANLLSIKSWAFDECKNLVSIAIPYGATKIEEYAFNHCTSLKSISIPKSLEEIETNAFSRCERLESIEVDTQNPIYESQNNCLVQKSDNSLILGSNKSVIPNNVTTIKESAFSYLNSIDTITLPPSIKDIENYAFNGSSITKIIMTDYLVSVGESAFKDCRNLKDIVFSNDLTYVGLSAFENTAWYDNQPDGIIAIGKTLYRYKGEMAEPTIIENIPSHIVSISDYAFYRYDLLEKIILPSSLLSIGKNAFYNCTSLNEVVFSQDLQIIEDRAFSHCTSLTEITLPNSLHTIGSGAFSSCSALNKVKLPNGLQQINSSAFNSCSALKNIAFPASLKIIGDLAFNGCPLQSITISKNITDIGIGAFVNNKNLIVYTDAESNLEGWYNLDIPEFTFRYWFPIYYSWIDSEATIIYNCTLSENKDYVESFTKSKSNITNPKSNLVLTPYREGYTFIGWSESQNGNAQYISAAFSELPLDITLYAVYRKN